MQANVFNSAPGTAATPGCVSLQAAESLTGLSRRTLWRRVADGTLPRLPADAHGRTMLPLAAVANHCTLPATPDLWPLVLAADAGQPDAQCELALRLLEQHKAAAAQHWLEQAARQRHPEATHWLALCTLQGQGRPADEAQGMVWLARAAALGHAVAQAQMARLRPGGA
jgi:hypothetical protein